MVVGLGLLAVSAVMLIAGAELFTENAAAAAGGLAALAVAGGIIGRWEGGLLVAAYLAGVALLWWREREPPAIGEVAETGEEDGRSRPAALGLMLALGGVA